MIVPTEETGLELPHVWAFPAAPSKDAAIGKLAGPSPARGGLFSSATFSTGRREPGISPWPLSWVSCRLSGRRAMLLAGM